MKLRFVMLIAACSLVACQPAQAPVTREALAGSYAYVSWDPEVRTTDHDLNHLLLRLDGTYDLIEGGTTRAVAEKKGRWRIEPGNPPTVVLDNAGYPVEIKRDEVRLLVDLDTGAWWTKHR